MQAHGKSMKVTWSYSCGGGGHVQFTSVQKRPYDGEDLNTLIASAMAKEIKLRKKSKTKVKDDSNLDDESESSNFEKIDIGMESDSEPEQFHNSWLA